MFGVPVGLVTLMLLTSALAVVVLHLPFLGWTPRRERSGGFWALVVFAMAGAFLVLLRGFSLHHGETSAAHALSWNVGTTLPAFILVCGWMLPVAAAHSNWPRRRWLSQLILVGLWAGVLGGVTCTAWLHGQACAERFAAG